MKTDILCKIIVLLIFFGLAVFSGTFILVDKDDDGCRYAGKQLAETVSNESSPKGITNAQGNDIIQEVHLQDNPVDSQGYWDDSETFVIDIKKFEESAASGNINIRLLERDFEIELDEITASNGGKSCHYFGHVKGVSYSKAEFYVYGEVLCGSIEFCDLMYTIAVTSEEYNGKNVHVVFLINWENERDKVKDMLNPLSSLGYSDSTEDLLETGERHERQTLTCM